MEPTDKQKDNEDLSEDNKIEENKKKFSEPKKETLDDKLKGTEDKLLRTMAEMENQRRRFEKERQEAFEFGGFNFAKESLSLLDNIDRATISFKNDPNIKNGKDFEKIIDGIDIVKKDLVSIFKKNAVEPIDCLNKKFDPNFHQAMLEIEDSEKEPGLIVDEMQKGFTMGERLLRPSLVSVTKKIDIKDNEDKNKPKSTEKHEENDKKNKQSNL